MTVSTSVGEAHEPLGEVLDLSEALVTATRELMEAAVTSDVSLAALAEATADLRRVTETLRAGRRDHAVRRHLDREAIARVRAGEPWRVFRHNPLGIPLEVTVDGTTARAQLAATPLLEGPPRHLHGGFSAAMMDALLSTLVQVQDVRAVTVRLDVAFLRPVPLDAPLELTGEIIDREGRKVRAEGRLVHHGEVAVRAEALFIEVPGDPD